MAFKCGLRRFPSSVALSSARLPSSGSMRCAICVDDVECLNAEHKLCTLNVVYDMAMSFSPYNQLILKTIFGITLRFSTETWMVLSLARLAGSHQTMAYYHNSNAACQYPRSASMTIFLVPCAVRVYTSFAWPGIKLSLWYKRIPQEVDIALHL